MIKEFLRAFILIFIAELGDKTQIIAMTFATKFPVNKVIQGVLYGVFLNHGIAIILGVFLNKNMSLEYIQIGAGVLFLFFGLNSLKFSKDEDIKKKKAISPVFTVAAAFFIGELGDKTQLTAMTLSAEAAYPFIILLGTTLGMVATSLVGIFIGSKVGDKIPEVTIKIGASLIFVLFGSIKLIGGLDFIFSNTINLVLYILIIGGLIFYLSNNLIEKDKIKKSAIKSIAQKLYDQTNGIQDLLDQACLGEAKCGSCIGSSCLIGYTRAILDNARKNENYYINHSVDIDSLTKKGYNKFTIAEALVMIIKESLKNSWTNNETFVVNEVRTVLEKDLFLESIQLENGIKNYLLRAKDLNRDIGIYMESRILKEEDEWLKINM